MVFIKKKTYVLTCSKMNSHKQSNYKNFQINSHANYAFSNSIDDLEANICKDDKIVSQRDPKVTIVSNSVIPNPFELDSVVIRPFKSKCEGQNGSSGKTAPLKLGVVIEWKNLSVEVNVKGKTKKILDNVTGEVNNLEMMAILGPSGSGKTTLLNAIAGRVKNSSGSVNFYSKDKNCTFAYVPQNDHLPSYLSVKENLLFSSRLRNKSNHHEEVEHVLSAFNLHKVKNHFTKNCSGGELKRLSIGLEMICKPKILILDEPTSGLDSTTSYIVVEVLKNINKNTAIITTIHQPNSNLFQLFNKCYILTAGRCIYNGTPSNLVEHLKLKINTICPKYTNPADFILDIANNNNTANGLALIDKLTSHENGKVFFSGNNHYESNVKNSKTFLDPISNEQTTLQAINRSSFKKKNNFFTEYFQNVKKLMTTLARDPQQSIFRTLNNIAFPLVIYMMTSNQLAETGCTFLAKNSTHILNENSYERYDRQLRGTQGVGIVFLNIMNGFFSALIPAVLVLSQHINVLKKEYLNSYYSLTSFYFAVVSVNFFFCLMFSFANTLSFFYFIGQEFTFRTFLLCWLVLILSTTLGDLMGLMLSILMPEDNLSAVVLGCFQGFAVHTFSGFFIPIDTMVPYLQKASWFIFCRHTFEAIIRIFYGRKCRIEDHMIFEFDNLVEFFKFYNYNNKKNFFEMDDIPSKVRDALREKQWNRKLIIDLMEQLNDLNGTEVDDLNNFWDEKTSYILETFNCQDVSKLSENFLVILVTIGFFFSLCYILLLIKIKK